MPKKKKLSKVKAREILIATLKENFGDRKEVTKKVGETTVTIPGFPKKIKLSHKFKEDLGLDSLDLTELAMADDIKSIATVGDAVTFFSQAVNERANMTKEEYEKKMKEKFNFSDMGIKEKDEL